MANSKTRRHPVTIQVDGGEVCPECGAGVNPSSRNCLDCSTDLGAPNVRRANQKREKDALRARYVSAISAATSSGSTRELTQFETEVREKSVVVIAVTPQFAVSFLRDARLIYVTGPALVDAGLRTPGKPQDDLHRRQVDSLMFPSYETEMRYGALALSDKGVRSYGMVTFVMRNETIIDRTSFSQDNTYLLVSNFNLSVGCQMPSGYVSTWEDRGMLAAVKHHSDIPSQTSADFASILLSSDGNRNNDRFIEAHIWGPFTNGALACVSISDGAASKDQSADINMCRRLWKKIEKERA